jgi:hypothetical protein
MKEKQMVPPSHSTRLRRIRVLVVALLEILVLSLLPVACRQTKTHARAPEVDSKNLKQTVVVATLDCPLPEHKNAIWCSTFQMAWDKLKQDIIGEPIQIPAAQELADRLNRSQFPIESIEEKSYYVAAGFVENGIVKQIRKEMAARFPSEPVPPFDDKYSTRPDTIIAYAYLNVDVGFQFPYWTCPNAFEFQDSGGTHTSVTAFSAPSPWQWGSEPIRGQVDILNYEDGQPPETTQFAVDLSRQTQPYQVILACMPHHGTFDGTVKALRQRINEFKADPDYEVLRKLGSIDTLTVPDVATKLMHRFNEMLNKDLGNAKWPETFISEAMQRIDFSLSRTGVVLKSEALVRPATRAGPAHEQKPRHLHFDRPFLICVQKREPNATPFFLMWVDNAELMKPYGGGDQGS